jgi:hypothetical protein
MLKGIIFEPLIGIPTMSYGMFYYRDMTLQVYHPYNKQTKQLAYSLVYGSDPQDWIDLEGCGPVFAEVKRMQKQGVFADGD